MPAPLPIVAFFSCRPPPAPGAAAAVPGELVIAHTNDMHAHFQPSPAAWLEGAPRIGGFVALADELARLREAHTPDGVLYLDAGDQLTGTPLMEFEVKGARGGAMLQLQEATALDAWVVGNHDFDAGFDNLSTYVAASPASVLGANLGAQGGGLAFPTLKPHVIIERNGLRIGVFGLTTPALQNLVSAETWSKLDLGDIVEVASQEVDVLAPQVDLVVALTHIGVEYDKILASKVEGIDLIVGGHSHTPLVEPLRVDDTWIVQTGGDAQQLGMTRFSVVDGAIEGFTGQLVDLVVSDEQVGRNMDLASLAAAYEEKLEQRFGEELSTVTAPLDRTGGESAMGRWASDLVRMAAGTDIGIYNDGGLRADFDAGDLTRGEIYEVFPFSNQLVYFELTGSEVMAVLHRATAMALQGREGFLQLSGLQCTWRVRMDVPEIVEVTVGGEPLDLERTYRVASNSYVASKWEHHLSVEPRNLAPYYKTVFEVAVEAAAQGPVSPPLDPRLVRVE